MWYVTDKTRVDEDAMRCEETMMMQNREKARRIENK